MTYLLHLDQILTSAVPPLRPDFAPFTLINQEGNQCALMLGHKSVATTEEYYAPWVKSRASHARSAYLQAHRPEPSSRVVPISKVGYVQSWVVPFHPIGVKISSFPGIPAELLVPNGNFPDDDF